MKTLLISIFLILLGQNVGAQNINFKPGDDFIKVYQGNIVSIQSDTAFIISNDRAQFFNQKLAELQEIKVLYNGISENRNGLMKELDALQSLLKKVASNLESDTKLTEAKLEDILLELDGSLVHLKSNNEALTNNNQQLIEQVEQLKILVKQLKKETRWLWWNGLTDKLVAFGGGVAVGIILISVL